MRKVLVIGSGGAGKSVFAARLAERTGLPLIHLEGPRPPLPPAMARISLLTPNGLHFGQAPFEAFTGDPMAAPIIGAAMQLMQALIQQAESRRGG
jgi:choline dehydrogenase-like flavoprotein